RPKILVVEDDRDILELLRYNLEKERFQVTCAMTGEAAVKQAIAIYPDLIILDLMLPGIDGLEVCRILKRKNETHTIPIILLFSFRRGAFNCRFTAFDQSGHEIQLRRRSVFR
ncbi:response regulator, partial [bacterium]|nr:response regulator [bacterium]